MSMLKNIFIFIFASSKYPKIEQFSTCASRLCHLYHKIAYERPVSTSKPVFKHRKTSATVNVIVRKLSTE